ncbi:hypothetical protein [Streptomyces sp. NBC_01268]|uniref:hypothetical protein n=1 Tax=unclassified Streptomyces TaxID=2593676 RepID=UPI002E31A023|nr:hypothetical protein [Streptomyces sp. NBC_01268]
MTAQAVRPLLSAAVVGLTLGAATLAGAPAAFAAPGDDGDIKVHRAGTVEPDQSNQPQVCEFHFAAFNFNDLDTIHWDIYNQPPGTPPAVRSGDIALDSAHNGYSPDMTLPDGMYKVEVTWVGQQGAKKSKVFRVDCDNPTNPPTTPPPTTPPPANGGGDNGGGNGGHGHHKPPHGPVGAGGGGSADTTASDDGSAFGVGSALAAGLAGTAGLILVRRARRRNDGAA